MVQDEELPLQAVPVDVLEAALTGAGLPPQQDHDRVGLVRNAAKAEDCFGSHNSNIPEPSLPLPSPALPPQRDPSLCIFPSEVIYNVAEQSIYMLVIEPLLAGIAVNLGRRIVHSALTASIYGKILRIISVLSSLKIISANNQLVLAMLSSTSCIAEGPGSADLQRGAVSSQHLRRSGLWCSSHLQRLPGPQCLAREGEVIELELGALPVSAEQLSPLDVQEGERLRPGPLCLQTSGAATWSFQAGSPSPHSSSSQ